MDGVSLTLVSRTAWSTYSGMLPGLLAGHYRRQDVEIDLERLCRYAGARFERDEVVGLDLATSEVCRAGSEPLRFDLVSLDTGCDSATVPGVARHALSVKPIDRFPERLAERWERRAVPDAAVIAVVGGGAGGIEVAAALAHRHARATVLVVTEGEHILPGYPAPVRRKVERALRARSIEVRTGWRVARLEPSALCDAAGDRLEADAIVWVTGARAPAWPAESGLATDAGGFIAVDDSLRSTSHPAVFAAGDVAAMIDHPRPKAGVFAVRQGPVLAENLRRAARGEPLVGFEPQAAFLSILALGDRTAIAARGRLCLEGRAMWRLKDRIDRRFVARYRRG